MYIKSATYSVKYSIFCQEYVCGEWLKQDSVMLTKLNIMCLAECILSFWVMFMSHCLCCLASLTSVHMSYLSSLCLSLVYPSLIPPPAMPCLMSGEGSSSGSSLLWSWSAQAKFCLAVIFLNCLWFRILMPLSSFWIGVIWWFLKHYIIILVFDYVIWNLYFYFEYFVITSPVDRYMYTYYER
jgi:hypothetical protein